MIIDDELKVLIQVTDLEPSKENIEQFFKELVKYRNLRNNIIKIHYKIVAPAAPINKFGKRGDVSDDTKFVLETFNTFLVENNFKDASNRIHKKIKGETLKTLKRGLVDLELYKERESSAHVPRLWAISLRITENTMKKNLKALWQSITKPVGKQKDISKQYSDWFQQLGTMP